MTWEIDGNEATFLREPEAPTFQRGATVTLPIETAGESEYDSLLEFLEYDASVVVRRGLADNGTPWFRERIPDAAPVETYLVDVDPPADALTDGFWGLIVGGVDQTPGAEFGERWLSLDIFVLAKLGEYADKAAVRDDLEATVV